MAPLFPRGKRRRHGATHCARRPRRRDLCRYVGTSENLREERGCASRRVARGSESSASPMRYPRCSDGPNQGYTPPTRQQLLSTWGDDSQAFSPIEDSERLAIMSMSRPNTQQHMAAGLPYDRDGELVATRRKIGGHERTLVPLYSRSSLAVRSAALSTLKQLDQPRPLTSWSSASWSAASSASQESKDQQWVTMLGTRGNTILGKLGL